MTTTILVQNIETFETIITLPNMAAFDEWMDDSSEYGIVSLDTDADGEHAYVALVVSDAGPDFEMDMTTGEMEPVESVDPATELAAKMDIAMELDMNDVPQEQILAMLNNEHLPVATDSNETSTAEPTPAKPRKTRKTKTKSKAKGAKMSTQPKRIRNFEILVSFIEKYPGVSRTDVFCHQDLLQPLRTKAQRQAIAAGDKLEIKRWNRRLNFLLREAKRQGVEINIERKGRIAHYTVVPPSGQLEIPFDAAAEARNSAIIGDNVTDVEVEVEAPVVDTKRADEPENVSLNFEDLLATLDDDAALITSDDQTAFEAAKEMLK